MVGTIKHFRIGLMIKEKVKGSKRKVVNFYEVDLVDGDIEDFLQKIPIEMTKECLLWVGIVLQNESKFSFVDGQTADYPVGSVLPTDHSLKVHWQPLGECNPRLIESIRRQAHDVMTRS